MFQQCFHLFKYIISWPDFGICHIPMHLILQKVIYQIPAGVIVCSWSIVHNQLLNRLAK
jgi:hypothetical protein